MVTQEKITTLKLNKRALLLSGSEIIVPLFIGTTVLHS